MAWALAAMGTSRSLEAVLSCERVFSDGYVSFTYTVRTRGAHASFPPICTVDRSLSVFGSRRNESSPITRFGLK